jgi:tRNA threonylcarbamoyladenosine biosynthesis protein TsaB
MNVLAIDTASPDASVALVSGSEVFVEALPSERRASEELLPALRRVLEAAGVAIADCDRIAVCAGPGSFTGVRVGLATAWGLSRAAGIPLETVSTLEAIAETARGESPRVLAVLDAGRGEVVCREFALGIESSRRRAAPVGESVRVAPERARGLAPTAAVAAVPEDLLGDRPSAPRRRPAAALALAVAASPGDAASSLEAIYSRPSAAEEKRGVSP